MHLLSSATQFTTAEYWLFGAFALLVVIFLVIDLGAFSRNPHKISTRSALYQSIFWVAVSLTFCAAIYVFDSHHHALEFLSAYLTEKALSVDNIFVIVLIFRYFKVEEKLYHLVLVWGILGAIVMRAIFIFLGALLIEQFHWVLYIFGAFLLFTGLRMMLHKEGDDGEDSKIENNLIMRLARRYLPFVNNYHGDKFYIRQRGKLFFTPLFLVVLFIESTDLIFAVDSIPAVFGVSQSTFVIYTSNIFAILGLRAMFFLLSGILDKFYLLQKGLSIVLIFIGLKMLAEIAHFKLPIHYSLGVIVAVLAGSIIFSLIFPKKESGPPESVPEPSSETSTGAL